MKIKWREHGIILITMLAIIAIVHDLLIASSLTPQKRIELYAYSFLQIHRSFNYYYNFLIPQIGSVIFLYGCYLWISLAIVPKMHFDRVPKTGIQVLKRSVSIMAQLLSICILLGPGVNFASYYINPYTFYYHLHPFPLTFGYHPQPFANVFGGLDISIGILIIYMVCITIREAIIYYYVERSAYRVMVANVVTFLMLLYFATIIYLSAFNLVNNEGLKIYYGCVPPMLLVIITNTYWLFPSKGEGTLLNRKLIGPLLFYSFVYTLVFSRFLWEEWSYMHFAEIWAFELFIITPISWLDYRRQRARILKIKGMEKELVKSKADLQFLRSQINPHFLFNALNTLYGTALLEGSKNTATGIQKLGDMMRFMLHENNVDLIPMSREINYLENYIALQKLRTQTSPDIMIEENISGQNCDHQIAPMLLIPLVENAFKHGISLAKKSWIKIELTCDDTYIHFEVSNSMHINLDSNPEKEQSGIGLENVKERLALLYPGKYKFSAKGDGREFVAALNIRP